jgi:hypothetical protein
MNDKTGGPAFPCIEPTMTGIDSDGIERWDNEAYGGMTLRDYFAAKAMQAYITGEVATGADYPRRENIATYAYAQADAMLKARVGE